MQPADKQVADLIEKMLNKTAEREAFSDLEGWRDLLSPSDYHTLPARAKLGVLCSRGKNLKCKKN